MVVLADSIIPKKMTTQVILGILDESIQNTVLPLFENTDLYSRYLLQMLFNFSTDNRRRFGVKTFSECAGAILYAIENRDYDTLKNSGVDRSKLMYISAKCLESLFPISSIEAKAARKKVGYRLKKYHLAKYLGCSVDSMLPMYNWSTSYSRFYDKYIQQIYFKYQKLLIGKANFSVRTSKMHVDYEQLMSNLRMAVCRAIDRCDASKGTLTSMVERTIQTFTNNPEFSHLYGIAFSVSSNVRRRKASEGNVIENFSEELENSNLENEIYMPNFDGIDKNLAIGIRKLRNTAFCHLVLNLPIVFTEEELNTLKGN